MICVRKKKEEPCHFLIWTTKKRRMQGGEDEETLTMTSRREINRRSSERASKCEREKNRHMHPSDEAISVIKTDEKWIKVGIFFLLFFRNDFSTRRERTDEYRFFDENRRYEKDRLTGNKENNCGWIVDNHLYCCTTIIPSRANLCFLSSIYLFEHTSVMIILSQKRHFLARSVCASCTHARARALARSSMRRGKRERLRSTRCSIVTIFQCVRTYVCLSNYTGGRIRK